MIKVLINDGIHPAGKAKLENNGFQVETNKVEQADLAIELQNYDAILVRSATKVRKELINQCPNLKLIGRGGVGLDNIDVDYAKSKNIKVINTPAASSRSVAELVIGHVLSLSRSLHLSHLEMPTKGSTDFKNLKKSYSGGMEIQGKTIGIVGFGRIGQALGSLALGMGLNVLPVDLHINTYEVALDIAGLNQKSVIVQGVSMEEMLSKSDFISLHLPSQKSSIITEKEIEVMKEGVILINSARGGLIDEEALLVGLETGKLGGAALDVFVNEPTPDSRLLEHPLISCSPHIGGSTTEAQENIGLELADQIIEFFG